MKWVDDLKASAAAVKDWGRVLTIICCVMAGSLVVIETRDGNREYGFIRWDKRFEGIDLIDLRYA